MAIEILMVTHNRLEYLKKALPSVLNQTYKNFKLTIWDNGSDGPTLDFLYTIRHPNVNIILNGRNDSLADVTSHVFLSSKAEFVAKVDSDIILPSNWLSRLSDAHRQYHFGFIGGFHFRPEDLHGIDPHIDRLGGVDIWRKHHIGGVFMIRRDDFRRYRGQGVMGLSEFQAELGLPNGYLWNPILWVEHMEDARSSHYIANEEYNDYKKKTRGMSLETYQTGIANRNYLIENATCQPL